MPNDSEIINTYSYSSKSRQWETKMEASIIFEEVYEPARVLTQTTWYRTSLIQFFAETGGLIVSGLSFTALFMNSYERFKSQTLMVETLYKHSKKPRDEHSYSKTGMIDADKAKKSLTQHLQSQSKFKTNYCTYLLHVVFSDILCCFRPLLLKCVCYRRLNDKYEKLKIARQRLCKE